jgi:hypothetical protein
VAGSHQNRHTDAERWVCKTHKHKWTDECHDRFAYTPTDITADDAVGQLIQFCSECGITCDLNIPSVPSRTGDLYDDL